MGSTPPSKSKVDKDAKILRLHIWFELDRSRQRLLRDKETVFKAGKRFKILEALALEPKEAVSKEKLREAGWGKGGVGGSLKGTVHLLRQDLNEAMIKTVTGVGYEFRGDVEEVREEVDEQPPPPILDTVSTEETGPSVYAPSIQEDGFQTASFFEKHFRNAQREIIVLGSSNNALSEFEVLKLIRRKMSEKDFRLTVFFANPASQRTMDHEIRFNRFYDETRLYQDLVIEAMGRFDRFLLSKITEVNFDEKLRLYYYSTTRPAPIAIVDDKVHCGFMLKSGKADGPHLSVDRQSILGSRLVETVSSLVDEAGTKRWPSIAAFRTTRETWREQCRLPKNP